MMTAGPVQGGLGVANNYNEPAAAGIKKPAHGAPASLEDILMVARQGADEFAPSVFRNQEYLYARRAERAIFHLWVDPIAFRRDEMVLHQDTNGVSVAADLGRKSPRLGVRRGLRGEFLQIVGARIDRTPTLVIRVNGSIPETAVFAAVEIDDRRLFRAIGVREPTVF